MKRAALALALLLSQASCGKSPSATPTQTVASTQTASPSPVAASTLTQAPTAATTEPPPSLPVVATSSDGSPAAEIINITATGDFAGATFLYYVPLEDPSQLLLMYTMPNTPSESMLIGRFDLNTQAVSHVHEVERRFASFEYYKVSAAGILLFANSWAVLFDADLQIKRQVNYTDFTLADALIFDVSEDCTRLIHSTNEETNTVLDLTSGTYSDDKLRWIFPAKQYNRPVPFSNPFQRISFYPNSNTKIIAMIERDPAYPDNSRYMIGNLENGQYEVFTLPFFHSDLPFSNYLPAAFGYYANLMIASELAEGNYETEPFPSDHKWSYQRFNVLTGQSSTHMFVFDPFDGLSYRIAQFDDRDNWVGGTNHLFFVAVADQGDDTDQQCCLAKLAVGDDTPQPLLYQKYLPGTSDLQLMYVLDGDIVRIFFFE